MSNLFSSNIYNVLHKSIDGASKRHEVLSNNMANIDTPGFKRSDVEFKSLLRQTINEQGIEGKLTHNKHIPFGRKNLSNLNASVILDTRTSMRSDGNNVDIDLESAEMAKNTLYHSVMTQQLTAKFNTLKSVISEGRR